MKRWSWVAVALLAASGCSHGGGSGSTGSVTPPIKLPPPPPPQADPVAVLGQALFHDKILSGNKDISCSTCHNQAYTLTDGLSVALGDGATGVGPTRVLNTGKMMTRNAPALFDTGDSGYGGAGGFFTGPVNPPGGPIMLMGGVAVAVPASAPMRGLALPVAAPGVPPIPTPSPNSQAGESFFWDAHVTVSPLTSPDPNLVDNPTSPDYQAIVNQLSSPLAAPILFPVLAPEEMRGQPGTNDVADAPDNLTAWKILMSRLVGTSNGTVGGIQGYRDLFSAAFPGVAFDDLNFGHAAQAIATFIGESFSASNTPFDAFQNGDTTALTASQQNGMNLFSGKANCSICHAGNLFSDFLPHAAAVPQIGPLANDLGVALVTSASADSYKFRTPSLRNVARTGPWMHDGAYTTLEGAVRHMIDPANGLATYDPSQLRPDFAATFDSDPTRNAARTAALDPVFATPPVLSASDVNDIVNFLGALTDASSVQNALTTKPTSVPSGLPVD
jgi:cytochrome c peroxidase